MIAREEVARVLAEPAAELMNRAAADACLMLAAEIGDGFVRSPKPNPAR